jgi:acyl-CoA synthetase (AMP-forming)/AMP-acid ligase II
VRDLDYAATVPELIRTRVERFGDEPFVLLNDDRMSYRDADERSATLARGLLATGIGKGTRIGLLAPNGPEWVVSWLAAARIGAVAVPMNTFYKPRELGWVMHHADVHTLLTTAHFLNNDYLERLETFAPSLVEQGPVDQNADERADALAIPELPCLRSVYIYGACDRPWARPIRVLEEAADGDLAVDRDFLARVEATVCPADPMVVIYSSGSTADPKGAIHSHGGVLRHSFRLNEFRDIEHGDRVFSPMPFFWVGGFVFSLLSAMHEGCFLICEEAFEPGETLALLERERATVAAGWPHYSKAMMEHPSFKLRDLSSIRSGNLYDILPAEMRPGDVELRSNSLGMTETCGPHSIDHMDYDLPEKWRGSFGLSAPGLEHKIVDPDTGETLGTGEFGEICVRGDSLMLGLHKVPREETFDADGFYHTGDAGTFDEDGRLYFKARLGEMIKTAGANVTPREVEVVMEVVPEIRSAFVVGVPHPDRGQNVAAAVILKAGRELDASTLSERLNQELSAYKVPRHVFFYADGELPFTDSGKIDKRRLAPLLIARIEADS